jgi:TonB family protein
MRTRRTQIAMSLGLAAALAAGAAALVWRGGSRAAVLALPGVIRVGPRAPGPTADQEGSRPPSGRSSIEPRTTANPRTAAAGAAEGGVAAVPPARKQRPATARPSSPRSRAPLPAPPRGAGNTVARHDPPLPSPGPPPASPAARATASDASSSQAAGSSAAGSGAAAGDSGTGGSVGGASDEGGTLAAETSTSTPRTDEPGADTAQANRPPRLTPPRLLATTGADYPSDAFRLTVRRQDLGSEFVVEGAEGIVALRVLVRSDGAVGRVEVTVSSGSEPLDRAAADAVRRWQFAPAMRDGVAIDAYATLKIRYVVR